VFEGQISPHDDWKLGNFLYTHNLKLDWVGWKQLGNFKMKVSLKAIKDMWQAYWKFALKII